MTIKTVTLKDQYGNWAGSGTFTDSYGGQDLSIMINQDLNRIRELTDWWMKWGPLFNSTNPAVKASIEDLFMQLTTMQSMANSHDSSGVEQQS